jgi:hypothetical protein
MKTTVVHTVPVRGKRRATSMKADIPLARVAVAVAAANAVRVDGSATVKVTPKPRAAAGKAAIMAIAAGTAIRKATPWRHAVAGNPAIAIKEEAVAAKIIMKSGAAAITDNQITTGALA